MKKRLQWVAVEQTASKGASTDAALESLRHEIDRYGSRRGMPPPDGAPAVGAITKVRPRKQRGE